MDIIIDYEKCREPETCGRCLKVCSPQVFALHPSEEDALVPKHWVVEAVWIEFCIQCALCVKECPHHAVTLVK